MKKIIIATILLLNLTINAQEREVFSKVELKEKAILSVENYLLKYMDKDIYTKYIKIDLSKSYGLFALPFSDFKSDSISIKLVEGFIIEIDFQNDILNSSYTFQLTNDLEIIEKTDFKDENYTVQYINSLKDFASKIEAKRILPREKVQDYVVKKYPTLKWYTSEIQKNSWPPYYFYYEVQETNCNPCRSLHIAVDSLEIIGGDDIIEMIAE
jgi:hypothetical protein